jgi:hypothetical protein
MSGDFLPVPSKCKYMAEDNKCNVFNEINKITGSGRQYYL